MEQKIIAKKSLGQNFLKCGWALSAIVSSAKIESNETVLEIGPGKGILTALLLKKSAHVLAVEKDDRMIPYLQEKFSQEISNGKLEIIHGDILEEHIQKDVFERLEKTGDYKLIANIPYYITGQLIENFLSAQQQPKKMVLMLQKEVTKRIVSTDKKESILSISVKAYGTPCKVADVPRSCFSPSPNVDSAILEVSDISKKFFGDVTEDYFFNVLKTGFAHKRKILSGNLSEKFDKSHIQEIFTSLGLEKNIRAENIPVEMWFKIAEGLKN